MSYSIVLSHVYSSLESSISSNVSANSPSTESLQSLTTKSPEHKSKSNPFNKVSGKTLKHSMCKFISMYQVFYISMIDMAATAINL